MGMAKKKAVLKDPVDLRNAVANVPDHSCLFVEVNVNGQNLWLGITGFTAEHNTLAGGLILKAEPIDAETLKRIGLPNNVPGTVHVHSSDPNFCGSVSMLREWTMNDKDVTCEGCRKNIEKSTKKSKKVAA